MDNTLNVQINTKSLLIKVTIISSITLVLSITLSNAYAVPNLSNSPEAYCNSTGEQSPNGLEMVRCCWWVAVEPGKGYEGTGDEYYCSECENGGSRGYINCSEPELHFRAGPTTGENIAPKIEDGIEQPPTDNTPPIRSDNSIAPNGVNNPIDEQQSMNPTFNPNKGSIINENLAQEPPIKFSSNDEGSRELTESDNTK